MIVVCLKKKTMYKLPQLVILNAWNVAWVQEYEFHIFKVNIYNTFHYEYFTNRIVFFQ
jgi:hypothetical protein